MYIYIYVYYVYMYICIYIYINVNQLISLKSTAQFNVVSQREMHRPMQQELGQEATIEDVL